MKKIVQRTVAVTAVAVFGISPAFAMPSAKEIEQIAPMVESLMKDDVAKMKQGQCKPSAVAENAVALAKKADTQAAKYYLLKSAVPYFAKDGKYDRIVATLDDIRSAIPDVADKDLVQLVEPIVMRAPKKDENAMQLRKMVDDYRAKVKGEARVEKMRQAIARNPSDRSLHTKLAEYMAVMGDWKSALSEFAQGDHKEAARIAKTERSADGAAKVGAIADFWWNYAEGRSKSVAAAIRRHAADLYQNGISGGRISGLAKVQAERRISEAGTAAAVAQTGGTTAAAVSASGSVSLREFTVGKDVKMRFGQCKSGTFTMGWPEAELKESPAVAGVFRQSEVRISKPYWMAETLVSERVWGEVMGEKVDSDNPKAMTYEEADAFLAKYSRLPGVKIPTGYAVRLPTYAEYEYALKAGGAEKDTVFAKLQPGGDEAEGVRQESGVEVTAPKPNKWGLRGLRMKGGSVWLADMLSFNKRDMSPTTYRWDATGMRIGRIDWPKSSIDPLVPQSTGDTFRMFLWDRGFLHPYGCSSKETRAFVRLVVAPPLKGGKK